MTATPRVAIVDYGLGNLFSVKHACEQVGLTASITFDKGEILSAAAVILPGVGAFATAMDTLHRLDLVAVLKDVAARGTPLMGICLGVQLLMTESVEFGRHRGLDLISGPVERLAVGRKVPHVGWGTIVADPGGTPWSATPLRDLVDGEYQYFVHSFVVKPEDPRVVVSRTDYGEERFVSAVAKDNIFACQFHPERSGERGLLVYRNLLRQLVKQGVSQ